MGVVQLTRKTNGSEIWKERTLQILNASDVFFTQDPANVMYERACESVGTCQTDQKSFKAYFSRWMAATTQMAPFTYDLIMPKIRASALAAAQTCTGGPNHTSCDRVGAASQPRFRMPNPFRPSVPSLRGLAPIVPLGCRIRDNRRLESAA